MAGKDRDGGHSQDFLFLPDSGEKFFFYLIIVETGGTKQQYIDAVFMKKQYCRAKEQTKRERKGLRSVLLYVSDIKYNLW